MRRWIVSTSTRSCFRSAFPTWIKANFGAVGLPTGEENGHGHPRPEGDGASNVAQGQANGRWKKTFYEPFDEIDKAALGLRFTLHLPVTAMIPPGHWELFQMAMQLAQFGAWCR